jgi:hypothetical protein
MGWYYTTVTASRALDSKSCTLLIRSMISRLMLPVMLRRTRGCIHGKHRHVCSPRVVESPDVVPVCVDMRG